MNKEDKKAFDLMRRRIENASMKFSIEVYRAFADAELVMNGEEPLYPATGVYVSRDEARVEESQRRSAKASEARKKKIGDPYP